MCIRDSFPRTLNLNFIKKQDMRYGENSHQQAAFYIEENVKELSLIHIFRMVFQRLDIAEDVIPAAAVQANNMVAQRMQEMCIRDSRVVEEYGVDRLTYRVITAEGGGDVGDPAGD